ncbi:MAG TPA: HAD family hydrolase [Candidatus Kryptonia bacterium]|nr:HAD family hydrolase [Candidatus Kryptonia bacterium]
MDARGGGVTIRAVIFDLDGTIADSIDLFYGFSCDVADDLGLPRPSRDAVLDLMRSGRSALTDLLPDSIPSERVHAAFATRGPIWLQRYFDETGPIPGSLNALRALHGSGCRLGIATSSSRDVPFLARWGVRDLFAAVVGREDVTRRKPAPDVIVHCLDRIGAPAAEAVYVGDSPIDIQAGKAAGVATVGVLSGTSPKTVLAAEQPDAILDSIANLSQLLEQWRVESGGRGLRGLGVDG